VPHSGHLSWLERNVVLHQKLHQLLQFSMCYSSILGWLLVNPINHTLRALPIRSPAIMRTIEAFFSPIAPQIYLNLSDRTWRSECNTANVALLQMRRSLSNKLEAGLNTRLTKTLRGENLIPWWICAVRSTTVTWKYRSIPSPLIYTYRATVSQYICVSCTYYIIYIYIYIYNVYCIIIPRSFS